MGLQNDLCKRYSHDAMQDLMAYLLSYNMESQAFAIDGTNSENVQTTGTKACILNGLPIQALTVDAELDISGQSLYPAWATATEYTTGVCTTSEVVQDGRHFVCISAHTSAAASKPLHGADWRTYWKELKRWAVTGVGNSIAESMTGYYLACVDSAGTLAMFKAYDGTATASTTLKIPVFDPERYVPVGILKVSPTSGAHVLGTTSLTTVGTFSQLVGPVFPHADLLKTQQT
jgi:hypothetical protein